MSGKIIDAFRIAIYVVLIGLIVVLFQMWDHEHPSSVVPGSDVTATKVAADTQSNNNTLAPPFSYAKPSATAAKPAGEITQHAFIEVTTDLMHVTIDPKGGNIVGLELLKYATRLHAKTPFILMNNHAATRYIAQSGFYGKDAPDTAQSEALYTPEQTLYHLQPNQNKLEVRMHWRNANGVRFTKTFVFERDHYVVNVDYAIDNQSPNTFNGNLYLQLLRKNTPPTSKKGLMGFATYFGAAISSPEKAYEKIKFNDMEKTPLDRTIQGGWAAMVQHYFVGAWVPAANTSSRYFSHVTPEGMYSIGAFGPDISVAAGQTVQVAAKFYAGPATADRLEAVAPHLQLTIDYGWLWFISGIIFWLMQKIYTVVGNWGWSIVLVTLLIKLVFYHLSAKGYRSMAMLKKLQPRINALREQYSDDKQKLTQATMELYRKEKVNPMGGCLPILVQIPVFIALYWVLVESVQLRQAPFIFWIQDLSAADPYYILPVLMGISMFLQQRMNPPPADPTQAKLMMLMPVVFTFMFARFPAGLMLYWVVNNTLSAAQQWFIMHHIEKAERKESLRVIKGGKTSI